MPITVLVPTWRITFPITCSTMLHVQHMYLSTTPSADASGYDTVPRSGAGAVGVSAAMTAWWNRIKTIYSAGTAVFGNARLEKLIGGSWAIQWTETNAVAPTNVNTTALSMEQVFSAYTTGHVKDTFYFKETIQNALYRDQTSVQLGTHGYDFVGLALYKTSGAPADADPYSWRRGRDGLYMGSWVSCVSAPNKRMRQARGLG